MAKITKRSVESIPPEDQDVFLWDDQLKGFGVRVKPSGVRSYLVQYRNAHGRSKRLTLGIHGRLTAEEARSLARKALSEAEHGGDPAEAREAVRTAPTVADLCARYLDEHARQHKRRASVEADERNIRNHVVPLLGTRKVADVTRADIDGLKLAVRAGKTVRDVKGGLRSRILVRGGPGAANRVLALLSKMFNLAERWGWRPDGSNPTRHIGKYRENKRDRYLTADELMRLGEVLSEAERTATETPGVIATIRLLIFTGCRLSEILTLRWSAVDVPARCLRLAESKTGAKVVHLNAPALRVLDTLGRDGVDGWVIRGRGSDGPMAPPQQQWRRLRARAGLDDVRLHDLRHSFASVAVGLGEGLPMIGKLLGHSQTQTTARYAHLAVDPVKAANERVGAAIDGMMSGRSAAVVNLPRR